MMIVEANDGTDWSQRYILIDPSGHDHSPPPDTSLREIFSSMNIPHFGACLDQGWVVASIDRTATLASSLAVKVNVGKGAPPAAITACLNALTGFGVPSTTQVEVAMPGASARVRCADIPAWIAEQSAPKKPTRRARRSLPQRVADEQASIVDDDCAGATYERVVWEREKTIETNPLDQIGFENVQGVYGVHVGDPVFWFNKLVHDYGRDANAWVIEIAGRRGDVLVEDVQYAIPDESGDKADSGVLFTTRASLVEGRDFRVVRHLTEADLDEESEGDEDYAD